MGIKKVRDSNSKLIRNSLMNSEHTNPIETNINGKIKNNPIKMFLSSLRNNTKSSINKLGMAIFTILLMSSPS
jgi:hypothetical protein